MPVNVISNPDYKMFRRFFIFSSIAGKKRNFFRGVFAAVFSGLISLAVLAAGVADISRGGENLGKGIVFALLGVIVPIFLFSLFVFLPYRAYLRTFPCGKSIKNEFSFNDNGFSVDSKTADDAPVRTKLLYRSLDSIVERKDAFYIYVTANQAYLLAKRDVPEDGMDVLSALFVRHPKYIGMRSE